MGCLGRGRKGKKVYGAHRAQSTSPAVSRERRDSYLRGPQQLAEDVAPGLDPVQHLTDCALLEEVSFLRALLYLLPGSRRGHKRRGLPPERVRRDRRLGASVLAPVQEHLSVPQGLGHLREHEAGVSLRKVLGELLGQVTHLV